MFLSNKNRNFWRHTEFQCAECKKSPIGHVSFVFEMQNLYIPEGEEYVSEEYPIRIKPVDGVDEFEEELRKIGSEYQIGYYFTARCYIEADEDRAEELADWIMQLYSFFQLRDVRWNTRYREEAPEQMQWRRTFQLPLDNIGHRLILGVTDNGPGISENIGTLVDTALKKVDEVDERLEDEIKRSLSPFLEAEGNNSYPLIQFLFLWIGLDSHAKRYCDCYDKSQWDFLFDNEEQDCIRDYVIEEFKDEFDCGQLNHLYDNLDQNYSTSEVRSTRLRDTSNTSISDLTWTRLERLWGMEERFGTGCPLHGRFANLR